MSNPNRNEATTRKELIDPALKKSGWHVNNPEQGIDPDELDFEGTDLEKELSNKDPLRKQWQEIMDVCLKGCCIERLRGMLV